jgi:hypothetical protein
MKEENSNKCDTLIPSDFLKLVHLFLLWHLLEASMLVEKVRRQSKRI